MRILRSLLLVAAFSLASVLASCGGGGGPSSDLDDSGEVTISTGEPPEETATAEAAEPDSGEEASLELPGLPIGGGQAIRDATARLQCATLAWNGPPETIPDGFAVFVTDIGLDPSEAFTQSNEGCPPEIDSNPPCLDGSFYFSSNSGSCTVLVAETGEPTGDSPHLVADGKVVCPVDRSAECSDFAGDVQAEGALVSLVPSEGRPAEPIESTESTEPGEPNESTATSDPTAGVPLEGSESSMAPED